MVWYISNISNQSDHCSKHQLRRKISEKNCQREGCCKKKWTKDDAAQCVFIWPCYHQEDVVCLYLSKHPTLCLPAVQQRWTRRESCDKGSFSLVYHHPLRGSHSPAKLHSFDPKPSHIWDNRVAEVGSLSARVKMATKVFVRCIFAIFATNASLLRVIANVKI